MMMNKKNIVSGIIYGFVFLASCNNAPVKTQPDTPQQGTINISVDESFKPVIDEQIKVYESTFPNAHIIANYKPEAECLKDLQNDSTRMVIVARGLTENEIVYYKAALRFKPQFALVAYDAVAVIVNAASNDTAFTLSRLQHILAGDEKITAVMDGKNATSTVRYLQDSILKGKPFGTNVVAAKNSEDVVATITSNDNAIGFVGLDWVGDNYDAQQQEALKKLKLGLVECVRCVEKGYFARPSAASISYAQYPLARPLYYIVKENATGLGTGFANFLSLERGQLIFRRAFLVPAMMNFNKRKSNITDAD
ncbi:PstS family phosphate ABC transporter substrate-binding protein [Parasediminibacterium sp. JCM 36343]|uniref:PstS family phosphate ABC transporter substrate-binding protein n=1 Tax=Parasediminibacterium sp. JCM 36343 TaxID=3374279 RepID=UPI00397DBA79